MSVTINLAMQLTITDGDADDDSTTPIYVVEKTIAGLTAYEKKRRIVNNTTVTMWSSTGVGESLTDFDFLALWVEVGSVEVELTTNDGDVNEAIYTVTVTPDVPLVLGADDSRYNSGALSGTADVIDLIRVKNGSATNAIVNLVLAT